MVRQDRHPLSISIPTSHKYKSIVFDLSMKSLFIMTMAIMACCAIAQGHGNDTPSRIDQGTSQASEGFPPEPITSSSESHPPGEKAYIFKYNQIFTNVVYVSGASGTKMTMTGGIITSAAILLVLFGGI